MPKAGPSHPIMRRRERVGSFATTRRAAVSICVAGELRVYLVSKLATWSSASACLDLRPPMKQIWWQSAKCAFHKASSHASRSWPYRARVLRFVDKPSRLALALANASPPSRSPKHRARSCSPSVFVYSTSPSGTFVSPTSKTAYPLLDRSRGEKPFVTIEPANGPAHEHDVLVTLAFEPFQPRSVECACVTRTRKPSSRPDARF